VEELRKPGRDPREGYPKPIMQKGVVTFEDLHEGMKIPGKIKNVVDFGAFVDLGIKESALAHISELSDHFVKDPLELIKVGDVLEFTIISLDTDRRRIGLSRKTNPGQGGESRSGALYPAGGAAAESGPARSGTVSTGAASAPAVGAARPGKKRVAVVKGVEKTEAAVPARPEARPAAGGFSPRSPGNDDGTMYNPFADALRKMREGKRGKINQSTTPPPQSRGV
jgi:uncharacterized protein